MKIQLQPNTVNNVTDLTGLDGVPSLYFQYLNSSDETIKIFFALSETPITSTDSNNADCFMHCDPESIQSTKQIKVPYQNRVYAWYKSTNATPVNLIVTDKQVADVGYADDSFASISTGEFGSPTSRLKTDGQPTSFEQNKQFKVFHRFNNIAGNEQIVYWFNNTVPVNIKERTIRLKEGKREYLVIPDPQDGTYDAVLAQLSATETPVRIVNSNLEDSGLPSHPTSDVTVLHGVGANLFTVADDDQFPNGDLVGVGAQGNNALNPSSGVDSNLSGVAANSAFFLVQIPYENEVTSGQFFLLWEER